MGSSCSKLENSNSPPRLVSVTNSKYSTQSATAPSIVITAASETTTPSSVPGNSGASKFHKSQEKNNDVETGEQRDSALKGIVDHESVSGHGTVVEKSNISSIESGPEGGIKIDEKSTETAKAAPNSNLVDSRETGTPLNQEIVESIASKEREDPDGEPGHSTTENNEHRDEGLDLKKKAGKEGNYSEVDGFEEDLVDGDMGERSDEYLDILSLTDVSQWESKGGVTLIRVGNKNRKKNKILVETQGEVDITAVATGDRPVQTEVLNPSVERDELYEKMAGIGELYITKPAPLFEASAVVDGDFKPVKLSDYRGKYVVLFFYPLDFTFVCPTEIIAFSDRAEEFKAIDCEVMACSTDSVYSHLAWVNTPRKQGGLGPMKIPLIADKTLEISKKYGCLKEDEGVAFRGLFIIDDKGNLRQITINDLPVGRSVDETLRLVQAFQFTDKHGEVCPAGWKPGKETMKPDPKASKEYFNKSN